MSFFYGYKTTGSIGQIYVDNLYVSKSLSVPTYSSAPTSNATGSVYFNTSNNTFYVYSGTTWLSGSGTTSGTSGTAGTSGIAGSSGTSGVAGSSGTSGTTGSSGTSGVAGSSGTSGIAGSSGTSGTAGSSGTSGVAGSSGTSGTTPNQLTKLVYLIYADETPTTGTSTNTSAKSTSINMTGYSSFIVETEIRLIQQLNTASEVTYDLIQNTTTARSTQLRANGTGIAKLSGAMKFSATTSSATIPFTASITVVAGSGTWAFDSLRIYGVT
jgi:hypothetical protein